MTSIEVDRDRSVSLEFEDGTRARFDLDALRAACPCASCRARRDRGLAVWPPAGSSGGIEVVDARLVGAWGLGIEWSDGHSTGIYAFEVLRQWADQVGEQPRPDDDSVTD